VYDAANICSHFLTLPFLANSVFPNLSSSYHIALKKIAYYDESQGKTVTPTSNNGMKLEMFIFDVFPFASKWLVCEALREDEFAPIKNANNPPGAEDAVDSPASAVKLMSNQMAVSSRIAYTRERIAGSCLHLHCRCTFVFVFFGVFCVFCKNNICDEVFH
jgi:UDP-N-acetylglucosamine pyrophosphorylase